MGVVGVMWCAGVGVTRLAGGADSRPGLLLVTADHGSVARSDQVSFSV